MQVDGIHCVLHLTHSLPVYKILVLWNHTWSRIAFQGFWFKS